MKTLKITWITQLQALSFHLVGSVMMLICLWWFQFSQNITLIFILFWLLYTLPTLYLHIQYIIRNYGEEYTFNADGIRISKKGEHVKLKSIDIKDAVMYAAPNRVHRYGLRLLPIESYYFVRFRTTDGKDFELTCLLTPNLDTIIKGMKLNSFYIEEHVFCTLSIK